MAPCVSRRTTPSRSAEMAYQFPSINKLGKLPTIEISAPNLAQKYAIWFREAEGIQRCIPPLYRDFVIRHTEQFEEDLHSYIEIVHYSDDLTAFEVCHIMDGKKVLTVESDYADYYDLDVHAAVHAPATTPWGLSWIKNEGLATVFCVLSVQAFILYHKPEVVPVELPEPARKNKKTAESKKEAVPAPKSHIKNSVRHYIRLAAEDYAPAKRNYRSIQWQVRGHYRHLEHKDGTKYAIYIKPHLAKRGNRCSSPQSVIVSADPENNEKGNIDHDEQ